MKIRDKYMIWMIAAVMDYVEIGREALFRKGQRYNKLTETYKYRWKFQQNRAEEAYTYGLSAACVYDALKAPIRKQPKWPDVCTL